MGQRDIPEPTVHPGSARDGGTRVAQFLEVERRECFVRRTSWLSTGTVIATVNAAGAIAARVTTAATTLLHHASATGTASAAAATIAASSSAPVTRCARGSVTTRRSGG